MEKKTASKKKRFLIDDGVQHISRYLASET